MGLMRKLFGEAFHSEYDNRNYRASFLLLDGLRNLQRTHGIDVRTPTYKAGNTNSGAPSYQGIPEEGFDEGPELYLFVENGLRRVDLHALCFVHAYGFEPYREYLRKKCLAGVSIATIDVNPNGLTSDSVVSGVLNGFKELSSGRTKWHSEIGHALRLKDGFWSSE
jgi:hypothetical protein